MKKALVLLAAAGIGSAVSAQSIGTGTLDAAASDPNVMGWMQGFPPAADRTVSAADGSFFNFPALRFSVCHMREFNLTRDVPARKEKYFEFKTKINPGIEGITFTPWDEDKPIGWQEFLDRNYTDGIIIVHKGKIVYEKYMGALKEDGVHAAMSVSKSFAGTVGAILVAQGRLDDTKPATEYVPELKGSGFDGATVREVMDMTTAIDYSEDYNDPNAGVWQFSAAGNPFRPANYSGPKSYYEYIPTVKGIAGQKQGEKFGYRTVNTEVLGWIISRATGKGLAELVSELIWKPLGAKYDAYYIVDPAGIAFAGGGLSLNLRDMAAFGEMIRSGGKLGGKQVIPEAAAKAVSAGGSKEAFEGSGYPKLAGWSYHNMWWITNNAHGAFMARGVHGQAIYIDPAAEMVIVRFASNPLSSNKYIDPVSIPAYEAVADYLMGKKK